MARNQVMKLWTTLVTAIIALCTALGLITTTAATTAAAAVPRTEAPSTSTPDVTVPAMLPWTWSHARALPPTMKQRIGAEAHGKSPSCRQRPLDDSQTETPADLTEPPLTC
ncbi:DUF6344 domain-containing protein [Streptomyces sp. V3I7]|uniref:DUF6344 domain-containing protein n=1 Tax=Streptomyces sp. V3I7 TaxID=3042278 RepID=UPI00277DE217|nr:DUF6344 domain-containing protein [Streptomyces sp. V3I7]MDQ0991893.1 hypothetical protein [Streptomyces sp. V3I7]